MPVGVDKVVEIVNVNEQVGLHEDDGEKLQVAPAGNPEHENEAGVVVPPIKLAVTVDDEVVDPCTTLPDDGLGEIKKANGMLM